MKYIVTMPRFGTMEVESSKDTGELRLALLSRYPFAKADEIIIRPARPPRELSKEEAEALDQVEEVDE